MKNENLKESKQVKNDKDLLDFIDMGLNEEQICINIGEAVDDIAKNMIMTEYEKEIKKNERQIQY